MATNPELLKKVTDGIGQTGYPLEQRVGHCLRMRGWHPFHAVTYWEPQAKTHRELDILAFKDIHNRRIELRISCKRSTSKQWIFFTEDTSSVRSGSDLKITPVTDNRDRIAKLPGILRNLPFFRPQRPAINFTALAGNKQDKEAKSLVRDGLLSSLSSVYWQPYPYGLLDDTRGIVYLFITVFDGLMFESFYDPASDQDQVEEIEYVQWRTDFPLWQGVT